MQVIDLTFYLLLDEGRATCIRLKLGPLPPNDVGSIAQHARVKGKQEEKEGEFIMKLPEYSSKKSIVCAWDNTNQLNIWKRDG